MLSVYTGRLSACGLVGSGVSPRSSMAESNSALGETPSWAVSYQSSSMIFSGGYPHRSKCSPTPSPHHMPHLGQQLYHGAVREMVIMIVADDDVVDGRHVAGLVDIRALVGFYQPGNGSGIIEYGVDEVALACQLDEVAAMPKPYYVVTLWRQGLEVWFYSLYGRGRS